MVVLARAFLLSLPPSAAPAAAYRVTEGVDTSSSTEDSIAPAPQAIGLSDPTSSSRKRGLARNRSAESTFGSDGDVQLRKLQPAEHCSTYTSPPFAHRPLVTFMLSIPAAMRAVRRAEAADAEGVSRLWPPALRSAAPRMHLAGFSSTLCAAGPGLLKQPKVCSSRRGYVMWRILKKRLEQLSHSLDCNEPQLRQIILLNYGCAPRESVSRAASRLSLDRSTYEPSYFFRTTKGSRSFAQQPLASSSPMTCSFFGIGNAACGLSDTKR